MMRKQELEKLNEKIAKKHPETQNGFFNNNHILFLGLRPGHEKSLSASASWISNDQERLKNCRMGRFLDSFCGESWNHVSFTNLCKWPDPNNNEPTSDEFCMEDIETQIELISPNIIICLGKFVGKQFGIEKFDEIEKVNNNYFIMIEHPSYLMRFQQAKQKSTSF